MMTLKQAIREGMCIKVDDQWLGVYMTPEGPKLVYNREVYALAGTEWAVECYAGKDNSLFVFYWNGERKISLAAGIDADWLYALFEIMNDAQSA